MPNAEITWTSNDAAVVRSFQKLEQGLDATARRMERLENQSRRQTAAISGGFDNIHSAVGRVGQALLGGGAIYTGIDMIRDGIRKAREEAVEAGKAFDEMFRAFQAQAGLGALDAEKLKGQILLRAQRAGVGADVATAGARGLVGAGFAPDQAAGPALDVLLRTQAAFVASGKPIDTQNLAKQAAAYFTSQGLPSTAGNLQKAMENAFALRAGAFELSDFAELGKQGAVFKGRLSQQEQLAAFGTLVDAMPAAEAGTSLRNVVLRLATSEKGRTSKKALEAIGLTPTDVDLVGENFGTALDRIAGGLAGIPEEQRAGVLKQLFEEAGVAPAEILLSERAGKYARYQAGMATSGAEFAQAASVMQKGRAVAAARLDVANQIGRAADDAGDDLVLKALEAEGRARGLGPVGRYGDAFFYQAARLIPGITQENALELVRESGHPSFTRDVLRRAAAAAGGEVPPGFTTVESLEARDRRRAEAEEAERQRRIREDVRLGVTREERTGGFRRVGSDFRTRVRGFFGLDDDKADQLTEALERNTAATRDNTRQSGGGITVQEPPSAALSIR